MHSGLRSGLCKRRISFARALCAAVLALCLAAGQNVYAWLETGTLLTNSASATYKAGEQPTSVSYSATAKILISNPKIFMWKDIKAGTPTFVSASGGGGLVTFTLCFSNGGANTAQQIVVTDVLPDNLYWMGCTPEYYDAWQMVGDPPSMSYTNDGWNTTDFPGCPPFDWPSGDLTSTDYLFHQLRWVVDYLDIGESACVWYVVRVGDDPLP